MRVNPMGLFVLTANVPSYYKRFGTLPSDDVDTRGTFFRWIQLFFYKQQR